MIKSIVPNPFSKDSSLADLTKKAELIKEGLSFTIIIKNIIFLAVLGFILSKFFQIPLNIILILVGTEIIITLIAGYLKIIKLKAVYDINTANNDAKGYRTLIITSEYYELIKTIFGVIAHIFSIGLIFLFFHKEISNIVTSSIPLNQISLKYFVFIFLGFKNISEERERTLMEYCRMNSNIVYIVKCLGQWDFEIDIEVENTEYKITLLMTTKNHFVVVTKSINL